jgi:2-oxoglutarate ferredoxin oxidoreductase subunit beta
VIPLEHGQPVRFGPPGEDGLGTRGVAHDPATGGVRVVDVADIDASDLIVHDAHADNPTTAFALSRLTDSGVLHQAPIGIFRQVDHPTYDDQARDQVTTARQGTDDRQAALAGLLSAGETWVQTGAAG